jgi:putative transposase
MKQQRACLDNQSRACNWLYNKVLEKANALKEHFKATGDPESAKVLYSSRGLRNLVPGIKKDHPYLKNVYSSPLKNTALRVTDSIRTYQSSYKGKRRGATVGWPRFRSWTHRWFSLFYDEPTSGYRIENTILRLSLGTGIDKKRCAIKIPILDAHVLKDKEIRNLRIVKQAGVFSMVVTVRRSVPATKDIKKIIALDPNHKNMAYGVDNEGRALKIDAPSWLKTYDLRLDELKSLLDRCKKKSYLVDSEDKKAIPGQRWQQSRRYKKVHKVYTKARAKRQEVTKLFCYRLANSLYKQYDLVAIGDYTPRGNGITTPMRRAMNNRSLIGRCKEIFSWVALKSGKTYHEFCEKGTTRTCHACNFVVDKGIAPHIRQWTCPSCKAHHIRDENVACNGLRKVLRNLLIKSETLSSPVPSSGRVLIKERWAWRVLSSGLIARRGDNAATLLHLQEIKTDCVVASDLKLPITSLSNFRRAVLR